MPKTPAPGGSGSETLHTKKVSGGESNQMFRHATRRLHTTRYIIFVQFVRLISGERKKNSRFMEKGPAGSATCALYCMAGTIGLIFNNLEDLYISTCSIKISGKESHVEPTDLLNKRETGLDYSNPLAGNRKHVSTRYDSFKFM